jgi:uncharacterized protein (DUF1697 family)
MVAEYMQSGNISFSAWKKVKEEIEDYIRNGLRRCKCDPLNIAVEADEERVYSAARITCACGKSNDFGKIEGTILNE